LRERERKEIITTHRTIITNIIFSWDETGSLLYSSEREKWQIVYWKMREHDDEALGLMEGPQEGRTEGKEVGDTTGAVEGCSAAKASEMEKWKEIYRSKELEKEMKKERREQKKGGRLTTRMLLSSTPLHSQRLNRFRMIEPSLKTVSQMRLGLEWCYLKLPIPASWPTPYSGSRPTLFFFLIRVRDLGI
jgi:hypothetical protein